MLEPLLCFTEQCRLVVILKIMIKDPIDLCASFPCARKFVSVFNAREINILRRCAAFVCDILFFNQLKLY